MSGWLCREPLKATNVVNFAQGRLARAATSEPAREQLRCVCEGERRRRRGDRESRGGVERGVEREEETETDREGHTHTRTDTNTDTHTHTDTHTCTDTHTHTHRLTSPHHTCVLRLLTQKRAVLLDQLAQFQHDARTTTTAFNDYMSLLLGFVAAAKEGTVSRVRV